LRDPVVVVVAVWIYDAHDASLHWFECISLCDRQTRRPHWARVFQDRSQLAIQLCESARDH